MTSQAKTPTALSTVRHQKKIGEVFVEPKANRLIMAVTLFLIHHLAYAGLPFLRFFVGLRRFIPFLRGMDMTGLDLPAADVLRAQKAVQDGAVYFAPNHPEMFTDWLIDWDVMSKVQRRCAFWGGFDIVNGGLSWLWLRHNLIANTPGGGGKAYSVKVAARGDGVLLHPEGDVAYTARTLQPVFPGVADLAERTAATLDGQKPTYIVPMVYRYRFVEDPRPGLHQRLSTLERRLSLPSTGGQNLGPRFFAFQRHLLARLAERHDIDLPAVADDNYFQVKQHFVERLLGRMELTLHLAGTGTVTDRVRRVRKTLRAIRRQGPAHEGRFREGMAKASVIEALHRYDPESYGQARLTAEQIAETLTRLRGALLADSWVDTLRSFMPLGCARRTAHVRVLAPLEVQPHRGRSADRAAHVAETLDRYRAAMTAGLSALDAEFAAADGAYAVDNAFRVTRALRRAA